MPDPVSIIAWDGTVLDLNKAGVAAYHRPREEIIGRPIEVLNPGGAFGTKAFQGGETAAVIALLKRHFKEVRMFKPKASRSDSSEVYFVATGFKGR